MGRLDVTLGSADVEHEPWYQLVLLGPCVEVKVELHPSEAQQRRLEGRRIPNTVEVQALIDTGASVSVVDESVKAALDPVVTNTVPLKGIGDDEARECPLIAARFSFPGSSLGPWDGHVVVHKVRGKTASQRLLLGRDFLVRRTFTYDGSAGRVVITD